MANAQVTITKKDSFGRVMFKRPGYSFISIETTDLHLGHTNFQKYVDAIRLEIFDLRGGVSPSVEIGHRDTLSEPVVFEDAQAIGEGADMVFTRLTAKYFRIRLSLNTNTGFFVWAGLEFFGAPAGRRIV